MRPDMVDATTTRPRGQAKPLHRGEQPLHRADPAFYRGGRGGAKASISQAIAAALARLQTEKGGKDLVSYFDGREGKEIAVSTLSRWIAEPGRFPGVFIPVLAELDPEFRHHLVVTVLAAEFAPAAVLDGLEPEDADRYREVLHRVFERLVGSGA